MFGNNKMEREEFNKDKSFYYTESDSIRLALEDIFNDPSVDRDYALKFIRGAIRSPDISVWYLLSKLIEDYPHRTDLFHIVVQEALDEYSGVGLTKEEFYEKAYSCWFTLIGRTTTTPEQLRLLAELIMETVPGGKNILLNPDRLITDSLLDVYMDILETFIVIPEHININEARILIDFLRVDFKKGVEFIMKHNIHFMMNSEVFSTIFFALRVDNVDIRLIRDFLNYAVITQEDALDWAEQCKCNIYIENIPLYFMLIHLSETGKLPDDSELLTQETLETFLQDIIHGSTEKIDKFLSEINQYDKPLIEQIILNRFFKDPDGLFFVLENDDVKILETLFKVVDIDSFYEKFNESNSSQEIISFIKNKCFNIYKYLLETSEETHEYKSFWDNALYFSIIYKEPEVFDFIADYYYPKQETSTISFGLKTLINYYLDVNSLDILFYYLDTIKEKSKKFSDHLVKTISTISKTFNDLSWTASFLETAMDRYNISCLSFYELNALLVEIIWDRTEESINQDELKLFWDKRCELKDYDIDSLLLDSLIIGSIDLFDFIAKNSDFYNRDSREYFIKTLLAEIIRSPSYTKGLKRFYDSPKIPRDLKDEILRVVVEQGPKKSIYLLPRDYMPSDKDLREKVENLRQQEEI